MEKVVGEEKDITLREWGIRGRREKKTNGINMALSWLIFDKINKLFFSSRIEPHLSIVINLNRFVIADWNFKFNVPFSH